MSNQWFTADLHEGHQECIRLCKRPFATVEDQHTAFVKNFNARVKPDDTVFHNGDFAFKNSKGGRKDRGTPTKPSEWLNDYNGNWVLIQGNHDSNNGVKTHITKLYLFFGGKEICIVHNPKCADPKVEINLVGHVHLQWKVRKLNEKSIMVNIGVDVWSYRPVSFDEIMKRAAEFKRNENGFKQVTGTSEEAIQRTRN